MSMNNKGFTLVELLAVMVILISISLVAVGGITESLVRRENKECKEQQELAVGAAKIYFSLNGGNSVKISVLNSVGDEDYFKDDKKIDKLKGSDVITISGSEYLYNGKKVGDSCS